jgi:translation elongation factor EF-G
VALLSDSEIGSGTEYQSASVSLSDTDSGAGNEAQALLVALTDQESGYGDDGVVAIAAALLDADVGTATDALGTLINLLVADSGSGAEAQHVSTGTLTIIRAILSIVDAFRYSASVTERTSTALTLSDSLYTEVSNEESL